MPEPRTTRKSPATKKTSQTKKRTSRAKAKKPKVALAKNKVAAFCGIIMGFCVISLALTIALSSAEYKNDKKAERVTLAEPQKTERVKETAPRAEPAPIKKTLAPPPSQPAKSQNSEAVAKKNTHPQGEKATAAAKPQASQQRTTQATATTSPKPANSVAQANAASQKLPAQNASAQTANAKSAAQNAGVQTASVKSTAQNTGANTAQSASAPTTQKNSQSSAASQVANANTQKNANTSAQVASQNTAKSSTNSQIASNKTPRESETIQNQVPRNRFDIPPASNGATIVIIIDDAGRSVENTKRYANLPFPITIAVLPKLPQSRACADAIRAAGKEVILHQPMQSLNHNLDPGPGKITTEMTTYEIARIVKENLSELGPGVRGLNNHEGSDVTSNEIKIGAVLDVCDEMGVYFLDSRTTAATKAPQAALERDMHIFEKAGPYLDNDIDRAKMLERMRETLAYANRHGRAIVIGHVDKSVKILPDLLAEMYPEMKVAGYRFATPSMLR